MIEWLSPELLECVDCCQEENPCMETGAESVVYPIPEPEPESEPEPIFDHITDPKVEQKFDSIVELVTPQNILFNSCRRNTVIIALNAFSKLTEMAVFEELKFVQL